MTYKILFIDEQEEAERLFHTAFIRKNSNRFTGVFKLPEATLDEMVEFIIKENPDAVLTDYSLNEFKSDITYEVEYDGGDLAREIQSRREDFPVFITTSLGDDAANNGADVKIIYEKHGSFDGRSGDNNTEDKQHLTFADKLYFEIKAYKQYLNDITSEFDALVARRIGGDPDFRIYDEDRLIELDNKLEGLIDCKSKVPLELKSSSNAKRLERLLELAGQLVEAHTNDKK